jgi:malic enzyme
MYKTKIEENPIKTNKTLKNIQAGLFFIWFSPTLAHVCKVFDKKKKKKNANKIGSPIIK